MRAQQKLSILHDMHRYPSFGLLDEYYELLGNLKRAIEQGLVKEIAPSSHLRKSERERWFIENQTGAVFRLVEPNAPFGGSWTQVELDAVPSRNSRPEPFESRISMGAAATDPAPRAIDPEHERLVAKSIFVEMHRAQQFGSWKDYYELRGRLVEASEKGLVKEVAPSSDVRSYADEKWFVESRSGIVFRLIKPDPPALGWWAEVEFPERAGT